ncbi:MAG: oxidoreductase [Proteobacteria bacterium]|nr:oxidoreductase [Pseudomonadota bacterium]
MKRGRKPKLAVWKFASCDGCQLSLLDCEDELLTIADAVEIAYFVEASRSISRGPYDLSLVEGSITTPHDAERIRRVRRVSRFLVTIGACATAGGIQALRNFRDVSEFTARVYAHPEYIDTLATSTAIADHVAVDFELRGCPINKHQLVELIGAYLCGRKPDIPGHSVCTECKRAGAVCVTVARGTPCLGPVTHAGCGALCPRYDRGCYGCYGPMDSPNVPSLQTWWQDRLAVSESDLIRAYRSFNAGAVAFQAGVARKGRADGGGADTDPRDAALDSSTRRDRIS